MFSLKLPVNWQERASNTSWIIMYYVHCKPKKNWSHIGWNDLVLNSSKTNNLNAYIHFKRPKVKPKGCLRCWVRNAVALSKSYTQLSPPDGRNDAMIKGRLINKVYIRRRKEHTISALLTFELCGINYSYKVHCMNYIEMK